MNAIQRPGNRMLAFSQYGDPKGKPLFYFHGWPASRLSGSVYDGIAKKLHIRIICPDRPGFGLSDYQQKRTLLDWPADVVAIADHLKLKKFAVMGVSGGGPYAAVCAYKIPERLTHAGIVVGLGPVTGPESFDGILWIGKIGWVNFRRFPWTRRVAAVLQFLSARYGLLFGLNRFAWGKEDRIMLTDSELGRRNRDTQHEAFRQGYTGPELDLAIYTSDWGFDIRDIHTPVYLWYGQTDRNVSITMAKNYARSVRGSKLTVFPGEGHLISVTHASEILKTLT